MVRVYVRLIRNGYMTIDDVPARWNAATKAALAE